MDPQFPPGTAVKCHATEQIGSVVHNILQDDGNWTVIVDIPHYQATLRRHFAERYLVEVKP